jgi:three-Cys-motif partner protein
MAGASEKFCKGCHEGPARADACCEERMDADGLPARCVGLWSEDKLFYLRRYADIFSSGMKNRWANRVYIDLFSGPGRCRLRPTGEFVDGSPLRALELPFTHYIFNDLSPSVTTVLKDRVTVRSEGGKVVQVWTGDSNDKAGEARDYVRTLGSSTLAFAFIDPPGIEFRFESLRRLTAGINVDVLVNVPLWMNINRQFKHRLASNAANDPLDLYFGGREWRDISARCSSGTRVRRLLDLYEDKLRGIGHHFVGDERTVRNRVRNAKYYALVFASKNPKGKEFWEKVAAREPTGQCALFS